MARTVPALIQDFLSEQAARRPEAPLLIQGSERATYGEIEAASNRISGLLADLGIAGGDRVGLLAGNSSRYVGAYYGALKAGALAVPLHVSNDPRTLRRLLADCEARAVICGPGTAARVAAAAEELPSLKLVVIPEGDLDGVQVPAHVRVVPESAAEAFSPERPARRGIDLDRASIIYTSGSTGRPRGAVLSHLNVVANTRSILEYLELSAEDRVLCLLPFPYVYGKSLLNTHVAAGGSLVLQASLVFPDTVLDAIERHEATGLSGVPSTFAILLNRSSLARRKLSSLRYVTQAGGGMPVRHIRQLIEALPGVRIFIMYGATEASARLSYLPPEELPRRIGSIGRAIPNVELTIRRDDGTEADVDEVGEIVARGSNLMEGYWGDAPATAEVLDRFGFHTGDLGRRDADGFLWVTGRKRDMIKSGAHRISPREIEEALLEHPDVEEAAVVGVPDEYLGEAILAHVTIRPGAKPTAEDLLNFGAERLPQHKVPRKIVIRASMPRNLSGKIDKPALRAEGGPQGGAV